MTKTIVRRPGRKIRRGFLLASTALVAPLFITVVTPAVAQQAGGAGGNAGSASSPGGGGSAGQSGNGISVGFNGGAGTTPSSIAARRASLSSFEVQVKMA